MTQRSIILRILPILLLTPILIGCPDTPQNGGEGGKTDSTKTSTTQALPDPAGMPEFNAQSAYDYVAKQVSFGTREPNSPGAKKAIAYFLEELGKFADTVYPQKFTHTGYSGAVLNLTNIVARFNPEATVRVLLCAHWDSRPRADMEQDESKRNQAIPAANDGASGVGVLLEIARILKETPQGVGVDIVLFDGEDYGDSDIDDTVQYFLGAKYFSRNLPQGTKPAFGILLDMVGDKEAEFAMEGNSLDFAYPVVIKLWKAASHLQLSTFKHEKGGSVSDDHIPLNEVAGIPTIDIIDIDLVGHKTLNPRRKYWHTLGDTMDNIEAATLGQVGKLLVYTIYKLIPDEMNQQRPA
ncbi:MAG: M28 family peptidase [Candidatus Kapaibacterium sp.]